MDNPDSRNVPCKVSEDRSDKSEVHQNKVDVTDDDDDDDDEVSEDEDTSDNSDYHSDEDDYMDHLGLNETELAFLHFGIK